jgi:hypothetical protein
MTREWLAHDPQGVEWEIALLLELGPVFAFDEVQDLLPHRTAEQIRTLARELDVSFLGEEATNE